MGNSKSSPRDDSGNLSHYFRRRISRNSDDCDGIEVADIASSEDEFGDKTDDIDIESDDNRANNARHSNENAELENQITESSHGHQDKNATVEEQEALVASTGHHEHTEVDGEQTVNGLESEPSIRRRQEVLDGVIRRLRKDPEDTRSDEELLWDYKPLEPENEYSEFRRIHENRNGYQRTIYTQEINGSDVYYKESYDVWQIRKWSTELSRRYSMREYREKTTLFQNGEIPTISSPPPKRFPRLGEEPIIHLRHHRNRAKFKKNNLNADTPAPWERKEIYDGEEEKSMAENNFMEEVTRLDDFTVCQKDNKYDLKDTGQMQNPRSGCNFRSNKDVDVKYAHRAVNFEDKATQENESKHSVKMLEDTTVDFKEYGSKEFCFTAVDDGLGEKIWRENKTDLHDKEENTWKEENDEKISELEVINEKRRTDPTSQDELSKGEVINYKWRTDLTSQDKREHTSHLKSDEEDTVSVDERDVESPNQQGKTPLLNTTHIYSDESRPDSRDLSRMHDYNENTPRTSQSSFSNDEINDGKDAEQKLKVKTKKKSKVGKLVRGVMKRARNMFRAKKNENEISEENKERTEKVTPHKETNENSMTNTHRSVKSTFSVKTDICTKVKEKAQIVTKTNKKVDRYSYNKNTTAANKTKPPMKKAEAFVFSFSPEINTDEQFEIQNKDSVLRSAKVSQSINNSEGDESEKDEDEQQDDENSEGGDRDLKLKLRRKAQKYGSLKHMKELKETKKTVDRYSYNENITVANQIKPSVKKAETFVFSFSPEIKPDEQFELQNKDNMNDCNLNSYEGSSQSIHNSGGNESEKDEVEKQDDESSDGGDRDIKLKLRKKAQKYGSMKHMKAIQKENENFKKRLTNLRSKYSKENLKFRDENFDVDDSKDRDEGNNKQQQREKFGSKSFRGQVDRVKQHNFDENTHMDDVASQIDTGKDFNQESKISDGQDNCGRILNPKKYGSLAHMKQVKQENEQKKERLEKISTRVDTWKATSRETNFSSGRILDPRKYGSLAHMAQIKLENEVKKAKIANIVSNLDTWKIPSQEGRNLGGRDDNGRILDPKQYGSIAHMNQIKQENARRKSRLIQVVSNLDTWNKPNPGSMYSLKRKDEWQPVYDHRKYGSVAHFHQAKDANVEQRFLVKKATTKINTWQPKSKMELLHKTPRQPKDNKTHVKQLQTTLKTAKSRIDTGIRSVTTTTKNDHLLGNYSRYAQDEVKSNFSNSKTIAAPVRPDLQNGKPIMYTSLHNNAAPVRPDLQNGKPIMYTSLHNNAAPVRPDLQQCKPIMYTSLHNTAGRHRVENDSMYGQEDKRSTYPRNNGTAIEEERYQPSWSRYGLEETRPKFETTARNTTIMNNNFPQMANWTKCVQGEARARNDVGVYNTTMEGPLEHHLVNRRRCEREDDRPGFDSRQWNTELASYNEHQTASWTDQTRTTSYLRRPQMSSARFPTEGRQYHGESGTPGKSRLPVPTFYKAPWPPYEPTSGANCSSH